MERALTKVGSLKVGSLWITKKAKEEFSNLSEDITVSMNVFYSCVSFLYHCILLLYLFIFVIVRFSVCYIGFRT